MKNALIAIALLVARAGLAQDDKSVSFPDPEYLNIIYYYASPTNKLAELEKKEAALKTKAKLGGFGGSSSAYLINGTASPVRIKSSGSPLFAIKMQNTMMMDPSAMLVLYKLEPKGGNRQAVLQESGMMGKSNRQQAGIKYRLKTTPTGVLILIPEEKLSPGEYGFINMMTPTSNGNARGGVSYTVFAFGIDN